MAYPSRADIVTAMRNPKVSFKAAELMGGSIIQKGSMIIQYSGGYTTVFPFNTKDSKKIAVRCWIADIGDAKKRSQEISHFLEALNNPYFCDFKYLDNALLINGILHPLVIMEWVEGKPLKEFINDNAGSLTAILPVLAENFKVMVEYFHNQDIAHGDLQHGNIMVKPDGSLVIIDYDSMYIKPLDGMHDNIKGLPGYQHPARIKNQKVSPVLDYFSELVIYLSLQAFANEPAMWAEYYETEDLLFSKEDFHSPNDSDLIKKLSRSSNSKISDLTQQLIEQLKYDDISKLSPLQDLLVDKKEVTKEIISAKWDKQPNPPSVKPFKISTSATTITNKF